MIEQTLINLLAIIGGACGVSAVIIIFWIIIPKINYLLESKEVKE